MPHRYDKYFSLSTRRLSHFIDEIYIYITNETNLLQHRRNKHFTYKETSLLPQRWDKCLYWRRFGVEFILRAVVVFILDSTLCQGCLKQFTNVLLMHCTSHKTFSMSKHLNTVRILNFFWTFTTGILVLCHFYLKIFHQFLPFNPSVLVCIFYF